MYEFLKKLFKEVDGQPEAITAEELIKLNGAFAAVYNLQTSDGQLDDSSYGKEEL